MQVQNSGSPRRSRVPLLLIGIGIGLLLVVGFALWKQNYDRVNSPFPDNPTASEEQTYPEIPRVSLANAKSAYDQGSAVFIDVRSSPSYESSHIKGAQSIPEKELANRVKDLDRNAWIIPYCT